MRKRATARPGFTSVLTLVFVVLFLTLWGVVYRQMAAVVRLETVQANRVRRDEGSAQALAQALTLLETGLPPTSPYTGSVTVTTSTGVRTFTVTFSQEGSGAWAVTASPTVGIAPPALPLTFGS